MLIASLGAGRMGRGIAHTFAFAGYEVLLIDAKPRNHLDTEIVREAALAEVNSSLASLARLGVFDDALRQQMMARIRYVPFDQAADVLPQVDVLFEGVPEVLATKIEALKLASAALRADAILASSTSTMLSTELAAHVLHPQRFLNAHWLNPAYLVPLVELSPHPRTDELVTNKLKNLLESIGKKPVVCAASPGFIVPRFQTLIMNEAARMIEQGLATPEDIDTAVRYGFGFRYASMGVVEFIDYGGVDILYHASRYLSQALDDPRFAAPAIINEMMAAGQQGLKTGAGFFEYPTIDVSAYRQDVQARQVEMLRHLDLLPKTGRGADDNLSAAAVD
jgi:3-hydroxybutyryl-CoA dehydrogenase